MDCPLNRDHGHGRPSSPSGQVLVETVVVPMTDGVELVTDVARATPSAACPALLTRTPYGRSSSWLADDLLGLVHDGWAVVVQDVRGRGESGGSFAPFHQEVRDGTATVDWCAAQSWCDGRVAMFGASYRGATQWLAARGHPQALRAIGPTLTSATFSEGWCHEGGIPLEGFLRLWALRLAQSDPRASGPERQTALHLADYAITAPPGSLAPEDIAPWIQDYPTWLDPAAHEYWDPIDVLTDSLDDTLATHVVARRYDLFCEGGLAAFARLTERDGRRGLPHPPRRLVVGPWSHTSLGLPVVGDEHYGPQAAGDRAEIGLAQARWLSEAIDPDRARALGTSARLYVLGCEDAGRRWLDLPGWPPPATWTELALCTGGRLLGSGPPQPGLRHLHHRPQDPVPAVGGRGFGHWPRPGPLDQSVVERREDVLVYTSPPLEEDLLVVGTVRARLWLSSDAPGCDVVLRLCDVHPDGRSIPVTEHGSRLTLGPHAEGRTLRVGSTAWHVAAGHRIRLHIAGSSAPRLQVHPAPGTLTVGHGERQPSTLMLPVLDRPVDRHT